MLISLWFVTGSHAVSHWSANSISPQCFSTVGQCWSSWRGWRELPALGRGATARAHGPPRARRAASKSLVRAPRSREKHSRDCLPCLELFRARLFKSRLGVLRSGKPSPPTSWPLPLLRTPSHRGCVAPDAADAQKNTQNAGKLPKPGCRTINKSILLSTRSLTDSLKL
jgi:hypothetical protein